MEEQSLIRSLYTPLQPTVRRYEGEVLYHEQIPHPELQPFIYCYWELKTTKPLSQPFTYRVVTDGCIDIFFEVCTPLENFIMGFCKTYTEFPLNNNFRYIGIRFLPSVFPHLYNVDASQLSNKFQRLLQVSDKTAVDLSNFTYEGISLSGVSKSFDHYFLDIVKSNRDQPDPRFYDAMKLILESYGVINVESDIKTGVSPRQLRRLFKYYIGDTPKTFSKVVRFQNILKAKPSSQSLRKNKLFYDLGYFDQAHFIKDFKNFYGVTPSKAFGR